MTNTLHRFEAAGLGSAPFRCIGTYVSQYQAIPGDPSCPIQPGTSCDYCGQGISNVYRIRSADGREFKVGCDCVTKTGDAGLSRRVKSIQATARKAASDAKAATLGEMLADVAISAKLASLPHPKFAGKTMLDFAGWMLKNAGNAGKIKTAKLVKAAL